MIPRRGYDEFREWVNPLIASRAELAQEPVRIARATPAGTLVDEDGREIEDLHGTQAFGHRNPAISAAVRAYLDSDAPSWFPSRVNPFAGSLARRLCERSGEYSNAWFAGSGTEAVEAALKLARAATQRPRLVGVERAYHGCTFGSVSLMTPGALRDPFGPHLPGAELLPFGDVVALERALASNEVAALVAEPIQVEGGMRAHPSEWLRAACELTAKHGTLLVADEVQTGLGRTGRFLASEAWPRRPDAVLLGKHLGGGLLPISAILTRRELWERAYGRDLESAEAHNATFSGNPAAVVAAHAALDLLDDPMIERIAAKGERFRAALAHALAGQALFDQVRGDGLAVGIALRAPEHPWLGFEHFGMDELSGHSTAGLLLCHRLYKRGFFTFVCGHEWGTLRLQPRFAIDERVLESFARIVAEELEHLGSLL